MEDFHRMEPEGPGNPKLRLREGGAPLTEPGKACPSCGAIIPSSLRVCARCGFNGAAGGKRRAPRARRSSFRWGRALGRLAGLALAAGLIAAAPLGWTWYQGRLQEVQRARVRQARADLDAQYPAYEIGQAVTLRSIGGAAASGVLVGVGPDGVLLESAGGAKATVPFHVLDGDTLLRFDSRLRQETVRRQAALPERWWEKAWAVLSPQDFKLDAGEALRFADAQHCAFCRDTRLMGCPKCGGRGTLPAEASVPCPQCNGTGSYDPRVGRGGSPCPFCRGTGRRVETSQKACAACGGSGRVPCTHCGQPAP